MNSSLTRPIFRLLDSRVGWTDVHIDPIVTGISPTSGPVAGNTTVTITGVNLSSVTAVNFGSVTGKIVTIASDTQMEVTSPPGATGTVDVTVTAFSGTSMTTSADLFTYDAASGAGTTTGSVPPIPALTNWNDPTGIQLLLSSGVSSQNVVDAATLIASLPPARLARSCVPGSWFLLTCNGKLLQRDPCSGCWHPVGCMNRLREFLHDAESVASSNTRIAIANSKSVQVWTVSGETQVVEIPLENAKRVAFFPEGDLLVATQTAAAPITLYRFGPAGNSLGEPTTLSTITGPIDRLAVDVTSVIWITTDTGTSSFPLWAGTWEGAFNPATTTTFAGASFLPTNLLRSSSDGFCLQMPGPNGVPETCCYSWDGCPVDASKIPLPTPPEYQPSGTITSGWINSGMPRCRWHRIRVDAEVPNGTGIDISYVATDFDPSDPTTWEPPSASDWQSGPTGALDILTQQSTGRYFKVQLILTSDGKTTPVLWSVRINFPRITSLNRLPAVYRSNHEAEDFTERFLANFDASIEDVDAAISRFPAMLDVGSVPSASPPSGQTQQPLPATGPGFGGVPAEVLPWLGIFLDVVFDPEWSTAKRQEILSQLPTLYPQRGTLDGLKAMFDLIFDTELSIQELAAERPWGALAGWKLQGACMTLPIQPDAYVGSVRLFGKARARFRLGISALGAAPIHAYGNPDLDPILSESYRFEIQIPGGPSQQVQSRMTQLIESQKPAHTVASIRFGSEGFVVGIWSAVGIDTAFSPPPPPVLGASGNIRLRRASLIAEGPPRGRLPLVVGKSSAVGVQTLIE